MEPQLISLIEYAGMIYPKVGGWAYRTWDELNTKYFGCHNKLGGIQWGLTPHGQLGSYSPSSNIITLHSSLIEPRDQTVWNGLGSFLGPLFARDVLLHEMVHQHLHQYHSAEYVEACRKRRSSHNNDLWINEINRIGPMLGLKFHAQVIKQRRVYGKQCYLPRDGYLSQREIASFPHPLRKKNGYYKSVSKNDQMEELEKLIKKSGAEN